MKRVLLAVVALALAGSLHAADPDNQITAENVIRVMNAWRATEGLPPLAPQERLMLAAGDRMRHMEDEGFWSHESPEGVSPFIWVRARDYQFQRLGENLATGFETARLLVEAWMESPGHRANIMSAEYEDCGVAVIEGATTGPAPGKSIVVLFGRPRSSLATVAR